MRRSITVVVVGLIVGIWIGSCTGVSRVGAYHGSQDDWAIFDLTSRVGSLEMKLSFLELSISGLEIDIMGLQEELSNAEFEVEALNREVAVLKRFH